MKEWFSNPMSWMSGNSQNQPQNNQHYTQGSSSQTPQNSYPQNPHNQFSPDKYRQDISQNHQQRAQFPSQQHIPLSEKERRDRMIQEFKDNFDGCAYTLSEREMREVFDSHDWNPSLTTPILIELFNKNKAEYFATIYSDLDQKEVVTSIEGNTLDRKIIENLNEKRKELVGGKLSGAYQEIQKLNATILDQKNTIASLQKNNSDAKEKFALELDSNSNTIKRLNNDNDILSNAVSVLQNEKKKSDELIKELRKTTQRQSNEIQELKEGTCIKVPNTVDFGVPIQVIWKLDTNNSNTTDWIGLFDCNGNLITSQNIPIQGSKSGTMSFDPPENYGEYCFKYHQVTTFLGMSSNTALSVSNIIKVGPTYSIIEEKNEPGEITLQIQRESGKFYFHSFTFGMYKIGGAYDEYLEMYKATEGENITFHPSKDEPLFNYEFRVFGEMSEGVICTLCVLGHTSFIQKRKRETLKTNSSKNPFNDDEDEEAERSTKRKKNNDDQVEEIETEYSNSREDKSQSHEVDSDHHISSECSDESS